MLRQQITTIQSPPLASEYMCVSVLPCCYHLQHTLAGKALLVTTVLCFVFMNLVSSVGVGRDWAREELRVHLLGFVCEEEC